MKVIEKPLDPADVLWSDEVRAPCGALVAVEFSDLRLESRLRPNFGCKVYECGHCGEFHPITADLPLGAPPVPMTQLPLIRPPRTSMPSGGDVCGNGAPASIVALQVVAIVLALAGVIIATVAVLNWLEA